MDSRVVQPDTCRLTLSDGDWLVVKKRLTAGDNKRMVKRAATTPTPEGLQVNLVDAGTAKILAYLLDWSLTDPAGAVILIARQDPEVIEAALDSIDPESYGEVLRAIETHEVAMQAERDAQKKIRNSPAPSLPDSPSPVPVDSPTTGSTD